MERNKKVLCVLLSLLFIYTTKPKSAVAAIATPTENKSRFSITLINTIYLR